MPCKRKTSSGRRPHWLAEAAHPPQPILMDASEGDIHALREQLIQQALESCLGEQRLSWHAAYDLLWARLLRLNRGRATPIPAIPSILFHDRIVQDQRSISCPWVWSHNVPARPPRDVAREKRRRELWYDSCDLFVEMLRAGQTIDGELPSLSERALRRILPALNRAVGGEREGIEPPSARWFRRQVSNLLREN